ncbi:uncharacterized protein LOC128211801 [Mya arenaria]|uniref:uncharacterized protein LOC128211801 n=1 Tax=Mya arenaria TaxID=6604 RepID=UPI0022DFCCBF|nr:uncharacterized protein LOC128211801 [Mya arenaria]
MSGVRVSRIAMQCTEKDLKIYFSKKGGWRVREIYYPLFNNDAVVILEDELNAETVIAQSDDYLEDDITVQRLPYLQVFPRLTADIDADVASFIQATDKVRDEIEYLGNVTLNRDKGGNLVSMSGNWYQLEWTWNKIDTIMREQVYAQTKVQTKLQLKEFKRRRQPDTYDANQDEGPDESRAPIPKPRKSKDLSETKTTEKHSDNHPQIKPSGAKHHEDDGVRPISVPSMHQSLHDDHASSFLHDRSRDADHRSSILHDRSRDGDHASSFLHERSGDGDHASRFVYDRSGDGNHASSILHDQNRDKVLHSDHPSSILHDRTRDKGSKKHVEVEPSDWDDPGHVHHGHKGMHVHFSASAESSHREHSQIKVKRDIYILTKNPDEIKFLDFEFGPVTVNVYVGLITMAETDVIVNAAMGSLVNGGGVAWAIASNASPELQKQCDEFVKTKGNLQTSEVMHTCAGGKLNPNVKNVIHAVGPIWSRVVGEKICTHQLIMAFLNSFSYGNDILKISTISVPLISSGIFGCPVEICAKAFLYAVLLYAYGHPAASGSLRSIHLVNNDDANTALTILALKQLIAEGAGRLLTDAEQLMSEAAHATAAVSSKTVPVKRVTGQKLELEDDGDRMRIPSRTEVSRPEVMMQSGAKTSTQKPSKAPQIDVTNMPETGSVHEPVPAWRPLPPAPKSEKSHSKKKK